MMFHLLVFIKKILKLMGAHGKEHVILKTVFNAGVGFFNND